MWLYLLLQLFFFFVGWQSSPVYEDNLIISRTMTEKAPGLM